LNEVHLAIDSDPVTVLSIDQALEKLAASHPQKAELVKLRFFTSLSLPEAAKALNLPEGTAKRRSAEPSPVRICPPVRSVPALCLKLPCPLHYEGLEYRHESNYCP
jgi:hypothetical protein